jgi:putative ABC transport system permease protein
MSIDRWRRKLALRVRSLIHRADVDRELDEELQYHVERQTAEYIRRGMTPVQARTASLRALGTLEFQKEQVRDARGLRSLEELGRDVVVAVRSLRRAPGFAVAVILTLALGIGANTAMFTLLRGTLLRPLPHRDGEQLLYLRQSAPRAGQADVNFSVPELADYRAASRTIAHFAEYSSSLPFTLIGADGEPERIRAGIVSGNFFGVMGLSAALGRLTSPGDDGPAAPSVTVLSHDFWRERFGGDSAIVGSTVTVNGMSSTIVGVVQPAPHYPRPTDVYVNMVTSPHHLGATMVTDRSHRMTEVFARLAPGYTVEQARDEITRIAATMATDHPEAYDAASQFAVSILPLREALNERAAQVIWLLMAAAGFVLLIACANVANLTLMRGLGREREMLVRATLGAGIARLRRLLVVENLTLALAGGALGILVAYAGLNLLVAFAGQFSPRATEIRVDGIVLLAGLLTSVAAALVLSFVPRLDGARALAAAIGSAGRRTTLGRAGQRLQRTLVVTQLAVSMVLLTGAGLLVRTIEKLNAVETGVRPEGVVTLDLPIEGSLEAAIPKRAEHLARYERMRERVAALPGVAVAALGSQAPLRPGFLDFDVKAEGRPVPPNQPPAHAVFRSVDPQYFSAAGIPLVAGRSVQSTDRHGDPLVVVLSASFATQLFGDQNPIGRRIAWTGDVLKYSPVSGEWRTVVGVVGDTRDAGLERAPSAVVYLPFAQEFIVGASLVVRTTSDPAALQPTIARAIREVEPRQLIERMATLEQVRDATVAPRRLNAGFIAAFAALALVIAMVGIAGVLAFSVRARTAEIGIRMSLGADASRVQRMVLGEGGVLLATGVGVGLAGAILAARLLRGLLFGITPYDPVTLSAVALMLSAVGVAACWLPALRAARVDPAVALRAD